MALLQPSIHQTSSPKAAFVPVQYTSRSSLFWSDEICRSVLDTNSFRFVADNAPRRVLNSFGLHQQRLARLSLQSASAMLVQRLGDDSLATDSISRNLLSSARKFRNLFLLGICSAGRAGLGLLRGLRVAIPQSLQIWASKNILSETNRLMVRAQYRDAAVLEAVSGPLCTTATELCMYGADGDEVRQDIMRALRESFPNELCSLIFLSTIRDNNSGRYFHPELARRFSDNLANHAILACHKQIYEHMVVLPLEDLTDQLDTYMKTVPVPRHRLLDSWMKLRAYRATIPMDVDPISAEIYFMKLDVAVAILEARLPGRTQ
jgi:hypothetical protein